MGKSILSRTWGAWKLNPYFGQHKFAAPAAWIAKVLGHMI